MIEPAARALPWLDATLVGIVPASARVKSYRFRVAFDRPMRAGQHVDVRLTAPDGYQAQRSYSIASAPGHDGTIELMIEGLAGGEVSGFFATTAEVGDTIEMRGPIGGAFVWGPEDGGPLLLVGGGSGVVPLLSMLRHRAAVAPEVPALLLYSARDADEAIAAEELATRARDEPGLDLMLNLTRAGGRRIDAALIGEALDRLGAPRHAYLCGANPFVGTVSDLLLEAGLDPATIRTERFGG
ncbi:FAD-binding oxidoreductase [Methylobacterium sp. J-068]|uniref:FAD-binding oxidoreductase n=1 Tax=Methylobacterium sp. J-068 TaxID=2836649 RepID=UPI001FBA23B2|nr:FAD-binding oxidoreductase [Methylobacterium sp. J-068]MCJ2034409.1 FAD-binding oxidoreductase [Methylobacterium sp. J-068]